MLNTVKSAREPAYLAKGKQKSLIGEKKKEKGKKTNRLKNSSCDSRAYPSY